MTRQPLLLFALAVGCADMGVEPSLLEDARVLAVRATPRAIPDDGKLSLEALVHEGKDLTWSACAVPWQPASPPTCSTGALALGTGNPIAATVPSDLDTVYVRLDAEGALTAVLRLVRASDSKPNPEVTAIRQEDDAPLPTSIAIGKTVTLEPVATNPTGSELVATFFTTGGKVDPWHTVSLAASTWTAPEEPGPVTLTVVVRDESGGVGWRSATVEVTP